jgi:hypothetical protein
MKRSARTSRASSNLSDSVHRQLNVYALAASAAGVSLLALTQPAEGKIVYTAANVTLKDGQPFPLDLNRDGKVDFVLLQDFTVSIGGFAISSVAVCHHPFAGTKGYICTSSSTATNARNLVRAPAGGSMAAAALRAGAKIQNGGRFLGNGVAVGMGGVNFPTFSNTTKATEWGGPWVNGGKGVKNRYLGLKFKIKGKFHFGWARLTVTTQTRSFTTTLTGYAYETIPNKAIIAGKTKGLEEIDGQPAPATLRAPVRRPATLGLLATGAPGLSVWRREESVAATR